MRPSRLLTHRSKRARPGYRLDIRNHAEGASALTAGLAAWLGGADWIKTPQPTASRFWSRVHTEVLRQFLRRRHILFTELCGNEFSARCSALFKALNAIQPGIVGSAPAASKSSTIEKSSASTASRIAVLPILSSSLAFTSAPASIKNFAISRRPSRAAQMSGVCDT